MKWKQLTASIVATGFVMMLASTATADKYRPTEGRSLRTMEREAADTSAKADYFEALLREPVVERSLQLDFDADSFVGFSLLENSRTTALLDFELDPMSGTLRPIDMPEHQNVSLGRNVSLVPLWLAAKGHQAMPLPQPLTARSTEIAHDDVTISINEGTTVEVFLWRNDNIVGAFYALQLLPEQSQALIPEVSATGRSTRDMTENVEAEHANHQTEQAQAQAKLFSGDPVSDPQPRPSTRLLRNCGSYCEFCLLFPSMLQQYFCDLCNGPACNPQSDPE